MIPKNPSFVAYFLYNSHRCNQILTTQVTRWINIAILES